MSEDNEVILKAILGGVVTFPVAGNSKRYVATRSGTELVIESSRLRPGEFNLYDHRDRPDDGKPAPIAQGSADTILARMQTELVKRNVITPDGTEVRLGLM